MAFDNIDLSQFDFIKKNKSNLAMQSSKKAMSFIQKHKRTQKSKHMAFVEDRKNQLDTDKYKLKVFLLMRRSLLKTFRIEQDEIQYNLYLKRKRSKMIIQKVQLH